MFFHLGTRYIDAEAILLVEVLVAEEMYALASVFSDTQKTDLVSDDETEQPVVNLILSQRIQINFKTQTSQSDVSYFSSQL